MFDENEGQSGHDSDFDYESDTESERKKKWAGIKEKKGIRVWAKWEEGLNMNMKVKLSMKVELRIEVKVKVRLGVEVRGGGETTSAEATQVSGLAKTVEAVWTPAQHEKGKKLFF